MDSRRERSVHIYIDIGIFIYIYIYIHICVCVCLCDSIGRRVKAVVTGQSTGKVSSYIYRYRYLHV